MKKKILLIAVLLVALIVAAIPVVSMGATGEASIVAAPGETGTAGGDFADVLAEYTFADSNFIKLNQSVDVDVEINKTVYLDLNGNNVTGKIKINGGALYVMDTATDSYVNTSYGKISATVEGGELQAVPEGSGVSAVEEREDPTPYRAGYLKVVEDNGVSFHRVDLDLTHISFSPSKAGISYMGPFSGDQAVADAVLEFGVVVSLDENNLEVNGTNCTVLTGFGAGGNQGRSSYLVDIMKDTNTMVTNRLNANKEIYARAYIKTEDGYIYGVKHDKTLKSTVEDFNTYLAAGNVDNQAVKDAAIGMYEKFESVMNKWEVAALEQAVEDDTLKILVVGNSHGLDGTQMLNEVFKQAAPGKKVVIGALYHSGCRIDQHWDYASNNKAQYIYYKTDSTKSSWTSLPKTVAGVSGEQSNGNILGGVTLNFGLTDEKWDIITLQQMSTWSAQITPEYNFDDLDELVNYIKSNSTGNPKLYWHTSWTHPNDDVRAATYKGTGYGAGWYGNYQNFFGLSQHTMYNKMVANINEHIISSGLFDGVIDVVTAIQYMQDVLGYTEEKVYRDGSHLSNLGRMTAAYLWYCMLTDEENVTLSVDHIPDTVPYATTTYEASYQFPTWVKDPATAGKTMFEGMEADIVAAVQHTLDHPMTLPEGTAEAERIAYANTMDGVWVCGDVTADLKTAQTVAGVAVTKVATAADNTVTITLDGEYGNLVLSRVNGTTMNVTSVGDSFTTLSGIATDSVFTFQAS